MYAGFESQTTSSIHHVPDSLPQRLSIRTPHQRKKTGRSPDEKQGH